MVARLGRVPLGWFTERNSGAVKKAVQDDVAALHHLVAHSVMELTAAITLPLVVAVYLFAVDPLMALVTLVPLGLGVVGFRVSMRGAKDLYIEYDASLAALSAAAVEFTNGISVIKTFGSSGRAHARFGTAAARFAGLGVGIAAAGLRATDCSTAPAMT